MCLNYLRVNEVVPSVGEVWKPPPALVFKLNFDAAVLGKSEDWMGLSYEMIRAR